MSRSYALKAYTVNWGNFYLYLPWEVDGMSGQIHAPAALPQETLHQLQWFLSVQWYDNDHISLAWKDWIGSGRGLFKSIITSFSHIRSGK
jgi:hypothetical protein